MAIGCYDNLYLTASFKGVPFEALEVSSSHGRRGAEGEFPFGEDTAYADLGRKIRTYTLKGRFLQNDHIALAEELIAACESVGPGELVHPTRGVVIAACKSLKIDDDPTDSIGVTTFDLEFVEANDWVNGFNYTGSVISSVLFDAVVTAVEEYFIEEYDPFDAPYFQINDVTGAAGAAIENINDEFKVATSLVSDKVVWQSQLELSQAAISDVTLNSAKNTFDTFNLGMRAVARYTEEQKKYDAFRRIANFNAKTSAMSGAAGNSQNAVYATARILAIVNQAKASLEITHATSLPAFNQLDQISNSLNQEINAARVSCNNLLFLELRNLLTSIQKRLVDIAYNSPATIIYDFGSAVHSLVAAYEIFNDAKRFVEIEQRNPTAFPWAVGPLVASERV